MNALECAKTGKIKNVIKVKVVSLCSHITLLATSTLANIVFGMSLQAHMAGDEVVINEEDVSVGFVANNFFATFYLVLVRLRHLILQ